MRYSTEPKFRKYVKGYGFYYLQENLVIHGKKLMDTATKTGIDASKTASKRVVQKTAEASMLRSDLRDFSDASIVVKGEVTVTRGSNSSRKIDP